MSSRIGTAGFRSFARAGCRRASCMMASTLRRECQPVWAGGRCRISALILTPGITCTFARRAVAPGVIRCGPFLPVMTSLGRTLRMTSGCSAGASGGAARNGRRCTTSGGAWSGCRQVERERPIGAALLFRFAAGVGARGVADADVAGGAAESILVRSEEGA